MVPAHMVAAACSSLLQYDQLTGSTGYDARTQVRWKQIHDLTSTMAVKEAAAINIMV